MKKQTKKWVTKDKSKIRICDMEDSHLDNAIAMLDRVGKWKAEQLISAGFEFLCTLRGEYAIMSVEQDIDRLIDHGLSPCEIHPLYYHLLKERERRTTMDTTQDDKTKFDVTHKFYIAGVQHHQMNKVLDGMEVGDTLQIVPEPTNKYDPNAVRLEYLDPQHGDVMCGYVPKKFSSEVSASIEVGAKIECLIVELDKTAKPWEQCKVEIREVE